MCKCDTIVLCVFTELIKMLSRCERIACICTLPLYNCYQDLINIFIDVIFIRVGDIWLIRYNRSTHKFLCPKMLIIINNYLLNYVINCYDK